MKNHIPNSKKNWKIISSITKISFGYHTYTFHWKNGHKSIYREYHFLFWILRSEQAWIELPDFLK